MAKVSFSRADIRNYLQRANRLIEAQIIQRLQYLGEETVKLARENGGYLNQTGNLRSSIGYMVLKDRKVIFESFKQVKDGAEGVKAGRQHAKDKASEFPLGFVLVVVAGQNYALQVESTGRDVLSSAANYARSQVPGMIAQLKRSIAQKK